MCDSCVLLGGGIGDSCGFYWVRGWVIRVVFTGWGEMGDSCVFYWVVGGGMGDSCVLHLANK